MDHEVRSFLSRSRVNFEAQLLSQHGRASVWGEKSSFEHLQFHDNWQTPSNDEDHVTWLKAAERLLN